MHHECSFFQVNLDTELRNERLMTEAERQRFQPPPQEEVWAPRMIASPYGDHRSRGSSAGKELKLHRREIEREVDWLQKEAQRQCDQAREQRRASAREQRLYEAQRREFEAKMAERKRRLDEEKKRRRKREEESRRRRRQQERELTSSPDLSESEKVKNVTRQVEKYALLLEQVMGEEPQQGQVAGERIAEDVKEIETTPLGGEVKEESGEKQSELPTDDKANEVEAKDEDVTLC